MAKVLVTGADGFIGSHLAEYLVKQGHQVRALALYNSFNSWGWLDDSPLKTQMEILTGDIRDPGLCDEICASQDFVFNLAALIAIPYSYRAPHSYVETNVLGTVNMCKAALKHQVKQFTQVSTSEVYGTAQYVPIDENHPLQPQSPYSASKISSDAMAMSFHNAFQLPVSIVRPFNTFGPRQSARAVIPTLISQIASGKDVIEIGDTKPTRDFTFVGDTCRGMTLVGLNPRTVGKTVNIGSNREHSVLDVIEITKTLMAKTNLRIVQKDDRLRPAQSEVHRLVCDHSLATEIVGYRPEWSFEEGLRATMDWFLNPSNLQKYKTDIYNV